MSSPAIQKHLRDLPPKDGSLQLRLGELHVDRSHGRIHIERGTPDRQRHLSRHFLVRWRTGLFCQFYFEELGRRGTGTLQAACHHSGTELSGLYEIPSVLRR